MSLVLIFTLAAILIGGVGPAVVIYIYYGEEICHSISKRRKRSAPPLRTELDKHGLRVRQDWSFVANMEHDLGYTHTSESKAACRHEDCIPLGFKKDQFGRRIEPTFEEVTAILMEDPAQMKNLEVKLKDAVDSDKTWEQEQDEVLREAMVAMANYSTAPTPKGFRLFKYDGVLTPNEARALVYNYGDSRTPSEGGLATMQFNNLRSMGVSVTDAAETVARMHGGRPRRTEPGLGRGVARPRDGDYDMVQS